MTSEMCAFFGVSPMDSEQFQFGPSDSNVIHGPNTAKLCFTDDKTVLYAITFKTELSKELMERKATDEDMEALAERFADIHMTEKLKISDLWPNRTRCGLINIEEGILKRWHAGRIVLIGDSAHKVGTHLGSTYCKFDYHANC